MGDNRLNKLAGMPTKQKIMAIVAVLIVAVVIWQVVGLFGGGSAPAPTIQPATQLSANVSKGTSGVPSSNGSNNSPVMNATPSMQTTTSADDTSKQQSVTDEMIKQQELDQAKYLDEINKLQYLKLEREIAENSQAVASAKLATAKAEKDMSDLLTASNKQVSLADYANKLADSGAQTEQSTQPTQSAQLAAHPLYPGLGQLGQPSSPSSSAAPQYVVVSVAMQLGEWSAVIGEGGKLYVVHVGDTLPSDSSVVAAIDSKGVTLSKDKKKHTIDLISSVDTSSSAPVAVNNNNQQAFPTQGGISTQQTGP